MKISKKACGIALVLTFGMAASLQAQIYVVTDGNLNGTISEYGMDGSVINASLVTGLGFSTGLALSGNDLFVSFLNTGTIGEYGLDGSVINASLISGLEGPSYLAISGNDLFVMNSSGHLGEYGLDGSVINTLLITGLQAPLGLAVAPVPEPTTLALAGLGAAALSLLLYRRKCRA